MDRAKASQKPKGRKYESSQHLLSLPNSSQMPLQAHVSVPSIRHHGLSVKILLPLYQYIVSGISLCFYNWYFMSWHDVTQEKYWLQPQAFFFWKNTFSVKTCVRVFILSVTIFFPDKLLSMNLDSSYSCFSQLWKTALATVFKSSPMRYSQLCWCPQSIILNNMRENEIP